MPFSRTKLMEEYIETALFVYDIVQDDCDTLVDSIFLKFRFAKAMFTFCELIRFLRS